MATKNPFEFIGSLKKASVSDPLGYYSHPLVGWIFRARILMGLKLLEGPYENLLEVGYGSGFLLPYFSTIATNVFGLDLEADPERVGERLKSFVKTLPRLHLGTITAMPYDENSMDCVVAFSILEHIANPDLPLKEIFRVLKPGGEVLIGMPAVNRFMDIAFRAIGFRNIDHHHVTTPLTVYKKAKENFILEAHRTFPAGFPMSLGFYHVFLFRKKEGQL